MLGPSTDFGTPCGASTLEGLKGEAVWISHVFKELFAGALSMHLIASTFISRIQRALPSLRR